MKPMWKITPHKITLLHFEECLAIKATELTAEIMVHPK
jgi:hypothetical protein